MTGFGSARVTSQGWAVKVECRSVNHRGLDLRVWAPRDWSWVEPYVQDIVRDYAMRGRVEVRVDVERDTSADAATAYIEPGTFSDIADELRKSARGANLEAIPTISDVLTVYLNQVDGAHEPPEQDDVLEGAFHEALAALAASRAEEGERLYETMCGLLDEVASEVEAADELAAGAADEYQERLETRVREALTRFELDEIDERSILQEVAIYAERSDVSEEIQRARSHCEKLREVFDSDTAEPVGKQIDFYLQELMREANTTGSKAGVVELTDRVISMKSAIEKMREQAANIE
jgi:uncharacterized protein (TIGR00255 family)